MPNIKEVEKKIEIGWLELMHKKRENKEMDSNPCSQICHAPEKRRLYSCMLIGHAYRPSAFMFGHSR